MISEIDKVKDCISFINKLNDERNNLIIEHKMARYGTTLIQAFVGIIDGKKVFNCSLFDLTTSKHKLTLNDPINGVKFTSIGQAFNDGLTYAKHINNECFDLDFGIEQPQIEPTLKISPIVYGDGTIIYVSSTKKIYFNPEQLFKNLIKCLN